MTHVHDYGNWQFQQYDYGFLHVYAIQVATCRTCGYALWDRQVVK